VTARVMIAGGGTGGHVFPALATASAIREQRPDVEVEFVGTNRGLESRLVPQHGWTLHTVEALPLARRASLSTLRVPLVLARASGQVARLIRERGVVAALCFGGYTAVPLALGARRTGTPLVVHEQNAVPGLANRLAARWAAAVALTVDTPDVRKKLGGGGAEVAVTGNPVRPGLDVEARRAEAMAAFDLDPDRQTLLVFGGSQGAQRLNDAVLGSATLWSVPERLQIVHAAGRAAHESVAAAWATATDGRIEVRCRAFIDRMDLAYAAADLALSRAGASTIAELTVMGLPSVLVPYPHATADHQTANARALAEAGAAVLIPDAELDAARLVAAAEPLLQDPETLGRMAKAAAALGNPDAADALARVVLEQGGA